MLDTKIYDREATKEERDCLLHIVERLFYFSLTGGGWRSRSNQQEIDRHLEIYARQYQPQWRVYFKTDDELRIDERIQEQSDSNPVTLL